MFLFCDSVSLIPLPPLEKWNEIKKKKRDSVVWVSKEMKIIKPGAVLHGHFLPIVGPGEKVRPLSQYS